MDAAPTSPPSRAKSGKHRPFRRAVLRGLGVVLPPLLTIIFFLWIWNSVDTYVLGPVETGARHLLVWSLSDVRDEVPKGVKVHAEDGMPCFADKGIRYVRLPSGKWIPASVYQWVLDNPSEEMPETAAAYYRHYVQSRWLRSSIVIPIFLCLFVLFLYLLGKFMAARFGRIVWNLFERLINQLPLIRTVYGSVKQVTDFIFTEHEVPFTRVVAVEYPRRGTWSIGFVTGKSMLDIQSAANEPVLSVLIPTSPAPMTGYTVTFRKSETVDLSISIDQAFQFIVSCGVVVPNPRKDPSLQLPSTSEPAASDGNGDLPEENTGDVAAVAS